MSQERIRPIVIGILRQGNTLFVEAGYDAVKNEIFYRPLGGGIEFGENSAQALKREFQEELGVEIAPTRYLGMLENIFTCNGAPKHELVLIYEADFVDRAIYEKPALLGSENGTQPIHASWKALADFQSGQAILYPTGLLDLLHAADMTK